MAAVKLSRSNFQQTVSSISTLILLLNYLPIRTVVQAQNRIIVINADQPNIWTLEQAHYLLAQMHRRNLDLRAKSLEDLDPNEITGLRFEVLKTLIEFGATFNQADAVSNRMFRQNQEFNSERRRELTAEADGLRKESNSLAAEIEKLEGQKADATSDGEKERLDAKITSKKTRLARVDKEIENINAELKTLNVSAGELKGTTASGGFNPDKLPEGLLDKAVEQAFGDQVKKFNDAPKLNASLRLDNFLQMQYEIIAKQLSLLRDELGPGERLLFLEMPQTLNVAHHEADKKWAQSWWKIAGYTKREAGGVVAAASASSPEPLPNQRPITTTKEFKSILDGEPINQRVAIPEPCPLIAPETFTNPNAINIDQHSASDHPSVIRVSTIGKLKSVRVTLNGLTHPNVNEVDVLLVGPQGQNAIILSDSGGPNRADNLNITLSDGSGFPPAPLVSGTFRPYNFSLATDKFPTPAPAPLGGSSLSAFQNTDPNGEWRLYVADDTDPTHGSIARGWSLHITTDCEVPVQYEKQYKDVFVDLDAAPQNPDDALQKYLEKNKAYLSNRLVRTVDLIPRQSSLNVSDTKLQTRAGAFNFILSTLFGFGSQLNIQRQREQFAQFVQQELYSSAFGKGSREFGWTFTPMPGMDRLQSGIRTTYAIVAVPDDATSLVLETNGCYFPRSAYQPLNFAETKRQEWNVANRTSRNCGGQSTTAFVVPIPAATIDGSNDFWVNRISYQPVGKGKQIIVLISGQNFSSQIGVLINGIPLPHSIGLAQPLIRDDSRAGQLTQDEFKASEIQGRIERIDANKIVFSFKMPDDYEGTPTITLIAPGKAIDLNWLTNIGINGVDAPATLSANNKDACQSVPIPGCAQVGPDMFFGDPVRPLRIDKVEAFRRANNSINVLLKGAGFASSQKVYINGVNYTPDSVSKTLIVVTGIPAPFDDQIQVTLADGDKSITATAVVNPFHLKIDKVTVVSYEEGTNRRPGVLVVRLEGSGFTSNLRKSPLKVRLNVTSSREAFLTIPNPNQTEVITLTDPNTKISVSTVVARKPPE
jgi:subtilisin-like proprotein convertase family protein